jgi:hypothetical protein
MGGGPSGIAKTLRRDPRRFGVVSVPVDQMIFLMHKFGPEQNTRRSLTKRPKISSLKRKFARWNPNFFEWFRVDPATQKYEPIIGDEGELQRREASRAYYRACHSRTLANPLAREALAWNHNVV